MNHPKEERTLVVIKPDGVQRSLIGEIIGRFEKVGLKLVAIKMLVPTPGHIEEHYTLDPEWKRITGEKRVKAAKEKGEKLETEDPFKITDKILEVLIKYMTSGRWWPWSGRGLILPSLSARLSAARNLVPLT